MGKFISAQGIKNFGESFNATVDRERKLKQQQDQFNQQMAFRNRQLGLLNIYRQDTEKRLQAAQDINKQVTEYGITSQYQEVPKGTGDVNIDRSFDPVLTPSGTSGTDLNKQFEGALNPFDPNKRYSPITQEPKEIGTKDPRVGADGYVHRWDPNTKEYVKTNLKAPETTGGGNNGSNQNGSIQSPHINSIKLDEAYGQYKSYGDNYNKSLKEGEDQSIIDADGNQVTLTKEQLKAGRDSHRKTFMIHANNRADALEKTYKGFEAFYNDFKDREDLKGAVSQGRLMDIISKDMAGFPADAIREMFELIVKTNG